MPGQPPGGPRDPPVRKPLSRPHPAPASLDPAPTGAADNAADTQPILELALEDTAALRNRGVAVAASPVVGYNPYDTGPASGKQVAPERATTAPKRTDLRQLSEWIKMQRRVEDLKKDDGKDPDKDPE